MIQAMLGHKKLDTAALYTQAGRLTRRGQCPGQRSKWLTGAKMGTMSALMGSTSVMSPELTAGGGRLMRERVPARSGVGGRPQERRQIRTCR